MHGDSLNGLAMSATCMRLSPSPSPCLPPISAPTIPPCACCPISSILALMQRPVVPPLHPIQTPQPTALSITQTILLSLCTVPYTTRRIADLPAPHPRRPPHRPRLFAHPQARRRSRRYRCARGQAASRSRGEGRDCGQERQEEGCAAAGAGADHIYFHCYCYCYCRCYCRCFIVHSRCGHSFRPATSLHLRPTELYTFFDTVSRSPRSG